MTGRASDIGTGCSPLGCSKSQPTIQPDDQIAGDEKRRVYPTSLRPDVRRPAATKSQRARGVKKACADYLRTRRLSILVL